MIYEDHVDDTAVVDKSAFITNRRFWCLICIPADRLTVNGKRGKVIVMAFLVITCDTSVTKPQRVQRTIYHCQHLQHHCSASQRQELQHVYSREIQSLTWTLNGRWLHSDTSSRKSNKKTCRRQWSNVKCKIQYLPDDRRQPLQNPLRSVVPVYNKTRAGFSWWEAWVQLKLNLTK